MSRKLLMILLVGLLVVAACSPQATSTPEPTEEATTVAQEATVEATTEPTEEPTVEPTVEEPTAEPTVEEPTVEEPTEEPTVEEPTAEPTVEEPTVEPTVEEPTAEPTVEEPTEEPTVEATAEEATVEPTAEEVAVEPTAEEATEEPTEEAPMSPTETPEVVSDDPFADLATSWRCPEGFAGQTLSVFNWSTYVAEDTISNFERLCDVTVVYDTFESGEALVARLRTGNPGYDIVVPPGADVTRLAEEELLVELDMNKIPNFANLNPNLIDPPYDPGNKVSIPYQWGTIGVGYNVEAVGKEITSWNDVWDYAEKRVAWLEDRRPMMGFGALMLGYDPNTTDEAEITAIKDYMIEKGANVYYIAGDDGQEQLARGEADIVIEYMGDIFQIIADCECDTYAYAIPEEGANVWVDNLAIPTGAQNIELAHVFIDYILDPQVGADISNYTAYASPNQAAIDAGLIDEAYLNNEMLYPSAELQEKLFFTVYLPEVEQAYNDAWDEIKIRIGA